MKRRSATEKKIESLRLELSKAREHWECPYLEEGLDKLSRAASSEGSWQKSAWVEVASLAGTCALHAEWLLLGEDARGWELLERAVRYDTWVLGAYSDKFFVHTAAMALIRASWIGRAEWAEPVAGLVSDSVAHGEGGPGRLIWMDQSRDFAEFGLWLSGRAAPAEQEDSGPWAEVRAKLGRGDVEGAIAAACAEHLRLASDAVSFSPVPRGSRLMAPELRLLVARCESEGKKVDSSWHPLLALPFASPRSHVYDEAADPIYDLIRRREQAKAG